MLDAFAPYMNKTLLYRPPAGANDEGATVLGDEIELTQCRIEPDSRLLQGKDGKQLQVQTLALIGDAETIEKDGQITLPDGSRLRVLQVAPVSGIDSPHHTEALLG